MSDRGETEAYLAAELDTLRHALTTGDHAAVARCLEHVRAEAGPETAAVLERALTEQETLIRHWTPDPAARDRGLNPSPAHPVLTPTAPADSVRNPPPRSREPLVLLLAVTVMVLLLVVAVLVTVIILR